MCGVRIAAKCCANAAHFVCGYRGANTAAANKYSNFSNAVLYSLAYQFRVIGVIVRKRAVVRAEVDQIVPSLFEFLDDALVERIAGMIRTDCYTYLVNPVPIFTPAPQPD